MKTTLSSTLSLSLLSLFLASCSLIPQTTKPSVEIPARWKSAAVSEKGSQIPADWWTLYSDETLNALEADAATQNLDIRAGVEAINQARAALKIAGADLYPSVNASANAGKTSTNPVHGETKTTTSLGGGLAVSYELDLFGANAAQQEAAKADLSAAQYAQSSLRLVTQADVAQTYFSVLTSHERVRIAEQNLKNARDVLHSIQVRFDNGIDSGLELAQQKVAVASSEAALATLQQQSNNYLTALAVLLGKTPQTFELTTVGDINTLSAPTIEPSQPSTLLERRPDVHRVESQLVAANADIGAARAAFYPSITLGTDATAAAAGLADPVATAFGLTSSLAAPIFNGGRLQGGLLAANASQRLLVETYRKTVLTAFKEVEDALAAVDAANARQLALKEAVDQAQKAYDISRKRYEVGTIDFQTMLNTQAGLLGAQDSYAQALDAKLAASVDLVKALGGGWKN